MKHIATILCAIVSAGAGFTAGYLIAKRKYEYEILIDEETRDEMIKQAHEKVQEQRPKATKEEIDSYHDTISALGYGDITVVKQEKTTDWRPPYVITPDEFYENEDNDRLSFFLFADGVLADDDFLVVHDVDDVVGAESLTHFGEYEDDIVYVRNEKYKTDYEISRDERTYEEFLKENPYKRGV